MVKPLRLALAVAQSVRWVSVTCSKRWVSSPSLRGRLQTGWRLAGMPIAVHFAGFRGRASTAGLAKIWWWCWSCRSAVLCAVFHPVDEVRAGQRLDHAGVGGEIGAVESFAPLAGLA